MNYYYKSDDFTYSSELFIKLLSLISDLQKKKKIIRQHKYIENKIFSERLINKLKNFVNFLYILMMSDIDDSEKFNFSP